MSDFEHERTIAIKDISRICDEAIEHEISWALFRELVLTKIERETKWIENMKKDGDG